MLITIWGQFQEPFKIIGVWSRSPDLFLSSQVFEEATTISFGFGSFIFWFNANFILLHSFGKKIRRLKCFCWLYMNADGWGSVEKIRRFKNLWQVKVAPLRERRKHQCGVRCLETLKQLTASQKKEQTLTRLIKNERNIIQINSFNKRG